MIRLLLALLILAGCTDQDTFYCGNDSNVCTIGEDYCLAVHNSDTTFEEMCMQLPASCASAPGCACIEAALPSLGVCNGRTTFTCMEFISTGEPLFAAECK